MPFLITFYILGQTKPFKASEAQNGKGYFKN